MMFGDCYGKSLVNVSIMIDSSRQGGNFTAAATAKESRLVVIASSGQAAFVAGADILHW
jgi:hypothetical protein